MEQLWNAFHNRLLWKALRYGVVSPNPRKFRHPNSSPATMASRSMSCPSSRKVWCPFRWTWRHAAGDSFLISASLSPFPPGDCLRQFGQAPCENRGRTATLERVFAADRQRGHLLQHSIVVAGLRTKARCRRPSGNAPHQRRLACRLAAPQFVRNNRI